MILQKNMEKDLQHLIKVMLTTEFLQKNMKIRMKILMTGYIRWQEKS